MAVDYAVIYQAGQIADGVVTTPKLAANAVTASKAAADMATQAELDAVSAALAAHAAVDISDAHPGTIDTSDIADGAVTAAKVAADVATQAELNAVAATIPIANSVLSADATADQVGAGDIAGATVNLTAGTWLIWGAFDWDATTGTLDGLGRLYVNGVAQAGKARYTSATHDNSNPNGGRGLTMQVWAVVVGGAQTAKLNVETGLCRSANTRIIALKVA